MNRTLARLAALERQAKVDQTATVWHQDMNGADAYRTDKHPGLVLTLAQLQARPEPTDSMRILVQYGAASQRHENSTSPNDFG